MEQQVTIQLEKFVPATELVILSRGHLVLIPFEQIIRIARQGFDVLVITHTAAYTCFQTLEEIVKELPFNRFARVHKSHIISLNHLHLLGKTVPVTDYYKRQLIQKLGRLLEQDYRWMASK